MIFTPEHVQAILEGRKTMTRRVCKPGEDAEYGIPYYDGTGHFDDAPIFAIKANGRLKWQYNKTYAVQPGRTKPGVARIRILAIRQERVQDISEADARAEGCSGFCGYYCDEIVGHVDHVEPREHFRAVWALINTRKGTRWTDNPLVWVLTFELVKDGA